MQNQTILQYTAILYARVSSEEQALRGNSLQHQEEILRQYCTVRNIIIEKVIVENYSAKSFNRPEWKRMIDEIRHAKEIPDLLIFTRWDRFSRNTSDAYMMIGTLRQIGVNPQAIEQPLDLSIPENKMMLAFYLAIPEVESDRRSMNIKDGMRKAKENGKWSGRVPKGYQSVYGSDGLRTIVKKQPEASIISWVFHRIIENIVSIASITHFFRSTV